MLRPKLARTFLVILVLFLMAANPVGSRAQRGAISPSIGINPGIAKITVKPGEVKSQKITLLNYGADAIPLSAIKMNIGMINDQGTPEFTSEIKPRSASDWVTIDKSDVILPPTGKEEVILTIKPPLQTTPGGYSTAIIFQAKLPSYYFDLDANARILPALSISVLVTVPSDTLPTVADLKINQFQIPRVVVSSPVPFVTEINNPTQFFVYADGRISLEPTFGKTKDVTELKQSILMPESSRRYVSAYTSSLLPGLYTATLTLNQGEKVLIGSARFVALPWQFLIGFIGLVLVILFLAFRRRFRRAYRVLLGQESSPRPSSKPIIR